MRSLFRRWTFIRRGQFDPSAGLQVSALDQLGLQRFEEAFNGKIVITVTLSTRGHRIAVLAKQLLIVMGAVQVHLLPGQRLQANRWRATQRWQQTLKTRILLELRCTEG